MIVALLALAALLAQEPGDLIIPPVDYPRLRTAGPSVRSFVPNGWRLEKSAIGDLNRDGRPDAALVLKMASPRNVVRVPWDEERSFDTNPRVLAVLFASPSGGYRLAVSDHQLIPRLENPNQDDPLDEVTIRGGALRVAMHLFLSAGGWGAGGSAYTFRWQDGGFKLIGFDRDSIMRNTGELRETSINFLTRRKLIKTGNVGSDRKRERWHVIPVRPLIDLGAIGDGLYFNPESQ